MAETIKLQFRINVRFTQEDIDRLYEICKKEIGLQETDNLQSGDFSRWYRNQVKTKILTKNGTKQSRNHRGKKHDFIAN